ncbi:hypothetical protein [Demequina sp.]|uniref:hypothetical protein n=1 Tax=Demequina sp. TaxID=2050685 RepID=UPI003D12837A
MMNDARIARRFTIVGVVVPLALTVLAIAAQLMLLPHTPDPLAIHWGSGGVDGSGPGWTYVVITAAMGAGLPLWLGLSARPRLKAGSRGWSFRFLSAIALGFSVFGAIAMTWAVAMQVGLDSWTQAPDIDPAIITGALVGLGAGLVGYAVQPKLVTVFEQIPAAHVSVAAGERVVWLGVAKAGKGSVAAITSAAALLFLGAVAAWLGGAFPVMWILLGVALLVTAAGLTMMEADVRVDANGIEVRGPAGWPRSSVALDNVASATAITVEALGSFGGWGWRRVPGAMGVILRSGEALRVERKEGHALVVTVDDAATAAALLTTLAEQRA